MIEKGCRMAGKVDNE